jgi:FkbM family methyltransferase
MYRIRQTAFSARHCFINGADFKKALMAHGSTELVDLHTRDGLVITIRQNYADAMTVAEIFLSDSYTRGMNLPDRPVIIDVGGFVGDFSLYAAKRLNARRVIVCEPSPRNWVLLLKNIQANGYGDRIEAVNKAVTDGSDLMMNVDAPDDCQSTISAYFERGHEFTPIAGISLAQLLDDHSVEHVDLLKIDCEGGEFSIIESTRSEVFSRIQNLVFEFHQVEGLWTKLEQAKERLRSEGYVIQMGTGLVYASRPVTA